EWRRGNIDDIIDREVDRAVGEVREESSWFKLWSTLASREKAQELATTAAERVYRSDPMKKAIEALATGLGKEIGKRIELATIDTAGPATQCMQAFLGRRYGSTVARIVDEMKAKTTKDKVREELAKSISEQIHDSVKEISDKTAERVVEIWLEFRRAHAKVLEIAERQDSFKRFLDTVKSDDMPRLDEI